MKGEEPASVREKYIRGSAAYVIVLRVGVLTNSTADLRHSLHTNNTLDRQIGHVCCALAIRRCPDQYIDECVSFMNVLETHWFCGVKALPTR